MKNNKKKVVTKLENQLKRVNMTIKGIIESKSRWECKLVQPLWKTVWRSLKKLEIELHMTQQSHFWAYTPRKPDLKETRAPQCSSQHCLS